MAKAPKPQFTVEYEGKDITADLTSSLIDISYNDKAEDESDEVTIRVEDVARLWQTSWKPAKGDKIKVVFGYSNVQIAAGKFQVDEITLEGPPDIVNIKAIATGVDSDLRTKKSRSFDSTTLKAIIDEVASDHGFNVIGEIPSLSITRITQSRETDLAFLKRMGKKYGFLFSPRAENLVFTKRKDIDEGNFVISIDRTDCSRYRFIEKSFGTYSKAKLSYSNPDTGESVESEVDYEGDETVNDDTLELFDRAEDTAQADEISTAALHDANSKACTGEFDCEGNPLVLSGNNIELTGFGNYTGVFQVTDSTHTMNKSGGYKSGCQVKRVSKIDDPEKQTPKVVLETLDVANIKKG